MTDPLSRVPIITYATDDIVYDNLFDQSFEEIVVTDVKSQNQNNQKNSITDEERARLYADPWAWKDELISMKESVEMTLTSFASKIAALQLHVSLADWDEEYTASFWEQGTRVNKTFSEIVKDLTTERNRRVNSIRFLHAVESKVLEAKAAIRELS